MAIESSIEAIHAAGEVGLYCVLFTIDATRTIFSDYLEFLQRVCDQAPPDAIAIADSYGVALPEAIQFGVRELRARFQQPVEVHCHNDFGLATACTLSGVVAGADFLSRHAGGLFHVDAACDAIARAHPQRAARFFETARHRGG